MGPTYSGVIAGAIALAAAKAGASPAEELSALLSRSEIGLEVTVDGASVTDRDVSGVSGRVADEKRLWLCDFRVVAGEGYIDLVLTGDLEATHGERHGELGRAVTEVAPREPAPIWFVLKPRAAQRFTWSEYRELWDAARAGVFGPVAAQNWHVTYDVGGALTFYAPLFEHWFDIGGPDETARAQALFEAVIAEECS